MSIIFSYIVTKNKLEAKKIGEALLKNRLAACIHVFNTIESMYWWKGKIQASSETVLIAKTTKSMFPKLCKQVKLLHSYSCPCIAQLEVSNTNNEYKRWLLANLTPTLKKKIGKTKTIA